VTDLPECTCPLIDISRFGPGGREIAFVLGDPRGSGCPLHETEAMRNEIKAAEHKARYGDSRNPGGPVLPPQPYLYDPAVDGPIEYPNPKG